MDQSTLYTAVAVGSIALYAVLRPGRPIVRGAAGLLALAIFAWLLGSLLDFMAATTGAEVEGRPAPLLVVAGLVAIGAAGRMITHGRPVYSALYFILVILSSAVMLLMLAAEFMAFALIIVYAGAILVTYLFVLMLAQQAADPQHEQDAPIYDRIPREPAAAVFVGFVMLALLSGVITRLPDQVPPPVSSVVRQVHDWDDLERMPQRLRSLVRASGETETFRLGWDGDASPLRIGEAGETAVLRYTTVGDGPGGRGRSSIELDRSDLPTNVQTVGLALVADFPVSLELAGIILLLAMFGAVVMARRQIELGEDEVRAAVGLRRLATDDHEPDAASGAEGGRS